jgi:hypothetical protein
MEALERPKACFYRQMRYLPENGEHIFQIQLLHLADGFTS